MNERSITINIANRPYNMKVDAIEEPIVMEASKWITKKINDFSCKYTYKDYQDLLAMVLLETVAMQHKNESEQLEKDTTLKLKIGSLDKIVSDSLQID